eukprot:TRINITY_DN16483_c0_g1_i1.p1 TRINITY_DN16483_c0_g1~~TRINITY_DN16483_c0_g1_i1.p1  ORF type:complete len:885 (+),score=189.56 TRINITY_DN16483_c0_g1_i1:378-2657(+)
MSMKMLFPQLPPTLTKLSLCDNGIRELPPSLEQMAYLVSLKLSRNELVTFPDTLPTRLTSLKTLWIDGNKMRSLPYSFPQLTQLQDLRLHGNPGLQFPTAVVERGVGSILTYIEFTDYGVQQKLYDDWKWREEQSAKETEAIQKELRECFATEREDLARKRKQMNLPKEKELEQRTDALNVKIKIHHALVSCDKEYTEDSIVLQRKQLEERLFLHREHELGLSRRQQLVLREQELLEETVRMLQQELIRRMELEEQQHSHRLLIERVRMDIEADVQRLAVAQKRAMVESDCRAARGGGDRLVEDTNTMIAANRKDWQEEATAIRREVEKELSAKRRNCQEEVQTTRDRLARQVRELASLKAECDRERVVGREVIAKEKADAQQEVQRMKMEQEKMTREEMNRWDREWQHEKQTKEADVSKLEKEWERESKQLERTLNEQLRFEGTVFEEEVTQLRHAMDLDRRRLTDSMSQLAEDRFAAGSPVPVSESIVSLGVNVGGTVFLTSRAVLGSVEGSLFQRMLARQVPIPFDTSGNIFVDRNPANFSLVLHYLRYGIKPVVETLQSFTGSLSELLSDADFYCLPEISAAAEEERARRQNSSQHLLHLQNSEGEALQRVEEVHSQLEELQTALKKLQDDIREKAHTRPTTGEGCMGLLTAVQEEEGRLELLASTVQDTAEQAEKFSREARDSIETALLSMANEQLQRLTGEVNMLHHAGANATRSVSHLEGRLAAFDAAAREGQSEIAPSEIAAWNAEDAGPE